MKKFLCAFLAASMLLLASCSGNKLPLGIYHPEGSTGNYCRINYRSDTSFAIIYGNSSERGSCVKENNKLTVDIDNSDCVYVFEVKDGKMIYDADQSVPSDKFVSSEIISDGDVFFLVHESNRK
jgi:hypothetical protein